jgi:hypothetical protein
MKKIAKKPVEGKVPKEAKDGTWELRCSKCSTSAKYSTETDAQAALVIHRLTDGVHNLTVEMGEPKPIAKGVTGPLGNLVLKQRFSVFGVVGDFMLEGWKLAPGVFDQETKSLRKCPIVSQIVSRRTLTQPERLLKPVIMSAWFEETQATVIEDYVQAIEPKEQKDSPSKGKSRYNSSAASPQEETMSKATKKKNGAATGNGFRAHKVVLSVQKMPKDGEAPTQAIKVLEILKSAGKPLSPDELIDKMKGKIESKQTLRSVLNLYRAKLHAAGFLKIAPVTA